MQCNTAWKAELRYARMERSHWSVLRWVPVEDLRLQFGLHQVQFHERKKSIFFQTQSICYDFDSLWHLVIRLLSGTFPLNDVDVIDWQVSRLFLALHCHAKGFVRLSRGGKAGPGQIARVLSV